jgi:hypothetical protein
MSRIAAAAASLVWLLLGCPTFVVGQGSCFRNLDDLYTAIVNKETFAVETFILCPNTVYNVGFLNSTNDYEGGGPPIYMRENSKILCGDDGSSANNCVLRGGGFHVISTLNLFFEVDEDPINVLVSGITFDAPAGNGVLLVSPGEIIFNDCMFRVRFPMLLAFLFSLQGLSFQ